MAMSASPVAEATSSEVRPMDVDENAAKQPAPVTPAVEATMRSPQAPDASSDAFFTPLKALVRGEVYPLLVLSTRVVA